MANPNTMFQGQVTVNPGSDLLQIKNAAGTVISWIDSTGTGQGNLTAGGIFGISSVSPTEFAFGTGDGDFSGSILLTNAALGPYSGGAQGSIGQINGITFAGNYPPASPYGTAMIDVGAYFTSSPHNQSIMGVNSAIAAQGTTHNIFALNGQLATPSAYTGNITAGWYCVYGENDHNGSGTMQLSVGVQGQSYQQGAGTITRSIGGYFETCSGFYASSTGGIAQNYGIWAKSGGLSGTLGANDTTVIIDTPYTGATFTNTHYGLHILDQTANGLISAYAIKCEGSNSYVDLGGNALTWDQTNAGISYKAAATLGIGNGNIGDTSGSLQLKTILLTDFGSSPTSSGTAGTAGEIVQHAGSFYVCSATGASGFATWGKLNIVSV